MDVSCLRLEMDQVVAEEDQQLGALVWLSGLGVAARCGSGHGVECRLILAERAEPALPPPDVPKRGDGVRVGRKALHAGRGATWWRINQLKDHLIDLRLKECSPEEDCGSRQGAVLD